TAGLLAAVDRIRELGPRTVLVTSIDDAAQISPTAGGSDGAGDTGELFGFTQETDKPTIGMIAVDDSGAYQVRTPRLPLLANGAGDVTAALFVAHLGEVGIEQALARTASSVHGILAETVRQRSVELA